ncbi:3-dehydroquinate synthase [Candidatus Peregrinibacteria bacterium]|nr:3-dehydroquinate synthase [Candidatus Peregrinibacteria bacterium]
MNKLILNTPRGNSEILVQENGLSYVKEWIAEKHPNSRIVIITDTNLGELYKNELAEVFTGTLTLSVPSGEDSKKLATVKQLCNELINEGITRSDVIIGFGGGMITDLVGFVASIYMRGIPFIAIPTSLLAMTDAAIGGKTGINLEAKNILGTFHPAELILLDVEFLNTLPDREFKSGLAETIKHAVILDASLANDLMKAEAELENLVMKSAQVKINVVESDPMESGLRKVLNFGHTFGHAIEQSSKFDLLHGEAIAIGMVISNKVAQKLGKQSKETGKKIKEMLEKWKLPSEMPEGIKPEDLLNLIKMDKKRSGDNISFIIAPEMGKWEVVELSAEELIDLVK